MHTQLVLMPGENDGPHLHRTVTDLAELWPSVRSVGIVPVGLTRFQANCGRVYRPDEAAPILDLVETWQAVYRSRFDVNWVYASDEWYLLDARPVPPAAGCSSSLLLPPVCVRSLPAQPLPPPRRPRPTRRPARRIGPRPCRVRSQAWPPRGMATRRR